MEGSEKGETTILIVDDDIFTGELTTVYLKKDYQVTFASKPAQALDLALVKAFSIILMDVNLGTGVRGETLVARIRQSGANTQTPIVAVTGFSGAEEKDEFLKAGFTHFLPKPFYKATLLALINTILHEKQDATTT
ncbi:MAG: response regulator [Bacteroidetes bacterium]|nr:response regulator [Bacteroidota bacterium]